MTTSAPLRPLPGPARPYHFPRFERRRLANGLTLLVAPVHALPLVTVMAVVDAGATSDPVDAVGVAQLTARALTEGTRSIGGEALTDELEGLGTSLGGGVDWDAAQLGMTVLRAHLDAAFARFAEVLVAPTFPVEAIDRLRAERLAELLQLESEPRELADERFEEYVYAAGSRFRAPIGGTRASVAALGRDAVVAFHAARYHPGGATLVLAGDITADDAVALAERTLGVWAPGVPEPARADDTPARRTRSVRIVRKDDAPQSEIRIGHVGVPRRHPDYFAITLMNAVLGGLFSSRINLNLREVHGYTYGASSGFDWRRAAGPFVVSTAVASEVTAPAVSEILLEIERMRAEPVSESELSLAASYLDGVFPIRYETTAAIAAALAALVELELPDDWYDTYRANVRAVTADDVLRAARTYLHPAALQLVVVGDAAAIEAPLGALDFGPVAISTP